MKEKLNYRSINTRTPATPQLEQYITVQQVISYDNLDNRQPVPMYRINETRFLLHLTAITF